ncbi:NAD(P)-binding protein [Delitschia confertaspora ATCC 74209]|uniref:NAD(P)-binding protein n=1 Tax=Delitschia confertaspora ATCC 74209 TaxID=1513339 RepID=A0A9P4MX69_9PLEO|nr:NAD(P)-binding protein [Delitschia confertaspora ATCC 74209]
MAHQNKLNNARVLVFGGTSGIGFSVANLCLSQGSYVTISGSNQGRIDSTIARLRSYYPGVPEDHINGYPCDLSDEQNMEANLIALFDTVTENGSKQINHVAFTAGDAFQMVKLNDFTIETAQFLSNMRITAPILIAKLINTGKYMPASSNSSFTVTGGVMAHKPRPDSFVISAFGGAMQALTRGLAVDLKPIRVNIVEPGAIKTEFWSGVVERMGQAVFEKYAKGTLVGEVGEPQDTAEAYAYLMKDSFITGTAVSTNGGTLLV